MRKDSIVDGVSRAIMAASAHVYPCGRIFWLKHRMLSSVTFYHVDRYLRIFIVRGYILVVKAEMLSQL